MLNSYLKNIFILGLLFPFMGYANFSKEQSAELNRKVFKTEQRLKEVLTRDLKLATGVKEILVNVEIKVSQKRIYNAVTSIDESLKQIEDMQLPSLFLSTDQQKKLKEVKDISLENIFEHITKMKLSISTPYDITDPTQMKEKIKNVLRSNYNRVDKIKLEIIFNKTEQLLVDNRVKSLTTPKYMKVISEVKQFGPYLLAGIGIIFLGFLSFLFLFKRTMTQMTSALDDIQVSGNLTANIAPPKNSPIGSELALDARDKGLPGLSGANGGNITSYIELIDKIRFLIESNGELVEEMILLHFHLGEIDKVLILLNILSTSDRENIYKDLPKNHLKDLQEFVVNGGEELYRDEDKLNAIAQEIFRVISIAMVKPESFYQIYLKKIIMSLSAIEIANVIRASDQKELMYFLQNVNGVKLAYVCATNDFGAINFKGESKDLDENEVKKYVHKLAKFMYVKDTVVEGNAKAKLIPHLSGEMETKYIESMGISKEFAFKNLVSSHIEYVQEYIKELDFEDIVEVLALFSEEERSVLIEVLPGLVAERLKTRTFELTERSFIIKIDLYEKLKTTYLVNKKHNIQKMNDQLGMIDHEKQKLENNITPELEESNKVEDDDVA